MSRKIKVKKEELLAKIKENRENHINSYKQALIDYKTESLKQLKALTKKALGGETHLRLDLIQPSDKTNDYDKLILMFEMEVDDVVELDSHEFNQYVHDETDFAMSAKFANTAYFRG